MKARSWDLVNVTPECTSRSNLLNGTTVLGGSNQGVHFNKSARFYAIEYRFYILYKMVITRMTI